MNLEELERGFAMGVYSALVLFTPVIIKISMDEMASGKAIRQYIDHLSVNTKIPSSARDAQIRYLENWAGKF
ncbi:MAG: hypothetical protein WCK90_01940 [archaeon]